MTEEKVIDFERIEYYLKLDESMDNDLIPLPDGVAITPDTWYKVVIYKDESIFKP